VQINPDYVEAYFNLGNVLAEQGRWAEAIGYFEQALQIQPDFANAHNNLGIELCKRGDFVEAIAHFEQAVQLNSDFVSAHNNLGKVFSTEGRVAEAIGQYEKVIQINPTNAEAHLSLAWLLVSGPDVTFYDGERAVELAEQAVRLVGQDTPSALDILATAYAQTGRYPEAVQAARRGINAAVKQGADTEGLRKRLAHYERKVLSRE